MNARSLAPFLAHAACVLLLFEGAIVRGRDFFFRDVAYYYYPNYVFLERSLRAGVWPLWNPAVDGGAPFLVSDPVDLLLVGLLGASWALRLAPPLHVLLAACGATLLAGRLGTSRSGAWLAGAVYGFCGFTLSTLNLFELSHAVAWGPWVVWAWLRFLALGTPSSAAAMAGLAAVSASTLSAETVIATGVVALVSTPAVPDRRRRLLAALAAVVAVLLAAPALLGAWALVAGTRRAGGFDAAEALGFSLHPVALLDFVLPRFFGDPHTFGDAGFWGQPFFPDGYPYLIGLYAGPTVLLLAARAPSAARWWGLALAGLLLALGSHGPLAALASAAMQSFRNPVKLLFVPALALALLAGRGLDRWRDAPSRGWRVAAFAPGLLLLLLALLPGLVAASLGGWVDALRGPRALHVQATAWPTAFAVSGALALAAGLALARGGAFTVLAGVALVLDLLLVHVGLNPVAASFYALRPSVEQLVAPARQDGRRLFSYGVAGSPPWSAEVARLDRDVWLYGTERQLLTPRSGTLDGFDEVFDEDRTGWAPVTGTLSADLRQPARFAQIRERLVERSAAHVLSLQELPHGLAVERGRADVPGLGVPLRRYEIPDAWPRAFWAAERDAGPTPGIVVGYERPDAHTVRLHADTPPGWLIVTDNHHPAWRTDDGRVVTRTLRGQWAVPTPGGRRSITVRYEPGWRAWAFGSFAAGLVAAAVLASRATR